MNKALALKIGQTDARRYTRPFLRKTEAGDIGPSFGVTHHLPLAEGPAAYKTFRDKEDGCIKEALKP